MDGIYANFNGRSLTRRDATNIHFAIRGQMNNSISVQKGVKVLAEEMVAKARSKLDERIQFIKQHGLDRNDGAAQLMKFKSDEEIPGPEEVIKDIRQLM